MQISEAMVAHPKYAVGAVTIYRDHHNREQVGEVLDIEAKWYGWGDGSPLVTYRIRHPSYRSRHAYVGERDILGTTTPEATHD